MCNTQRAILLLLLLLLSIPSTYLVLYLKPSLKHKKLYRTLLLSSCITVWSFSFGFGFVAVSPSAGCDICPSKGHDIVAG